MQLERNKAAPSGQRYPSLKIIKNVPGLRGHKIMVTCPLNGMFLYYGNGCSSI